MCISRSKVDLADPRTRRHVFLGLRRSLPWPGRRPGACPRGAHHAPGSEFARPTTFLPTNCSGSRLRMAPRIGASRPPRSPGITAGGRPWAPALLEYCPHAHSPWRNRRRVWSRVSRAVCDRSRRGGVGTGCLACLGVVSAINSPKLGRGQLLCPSAPAKRPRQDKKTCELPPSLGSKLSPDCLLSFVVSNVTAHIPEEKGALKRFFLCPRSGGRWRGCQRWSAVTGRIRGAGYKRGADGSGVQVEKSDANPRPRDEDGRSDAPTTTATEGREEYGDEAAAGSRRRLGLRRGRFVRIAFSGLEHLPPRRFFLGAGIDRAPLLARCARPAPAMAA